jgi:hypothetical protein
MLDLVGKEIRMGEVAATLGMVAAEALLSLEASTKESGEQKARSFTLALQVHAAGTLDVPVEDVALIKRKIGEAWGPLVVGRAYEAIEGGA